MSIKKLLYWCIFLAFYTPLFAKEYTVGVEYIDYYPFYSVNHNGEYVGYARDVLDLFSKTRKIKFTYEVRTVRKLDQEFLAERRFDFKFPDNKSWKAENKKGFELFYSSPVCDFTDGVIVQEENQEKDLKFFKATGIGTVRGYSMPGYEKTDVPILESPNITTLIENLKYNRIAGAYFNVAVALNRVSSNEGGKEKFIFNQKLPYYKSSFYLSTFDHPDIIYDFNQFLKEHAAEINNLRQKYGIKE
ncbi:MAG: transporter substrate-binding domain-containing protein [Bdellovibrionota bacterium]